MIVWTQAYCPFSLGGSVHRPIGVEINASMLDSVDLGRGYRGFIITSPRTGATYVAEAETGAFIGTDLEEVRDDIQAADERVMTRQIVSARVMSKSVSVQPPDRFWGLLGRNKPSAADTPMTPEEQLEEEARRDYRAVLGQCLYVNELIGYVGDDSKDFDFISPVLVKVIETSEDDIVRWMDDWLDPIWNIEIVSAPQELPKNLGSTWIHGKSYNLNQSPQPPRAWWPAVGAPVMGIPKL